MSFRRDLIKLLNSYSKENGSITPDFLLADYLVSCLSNFDNIVNQREEWFGRETDTISVVEKTGKNE